LVQNDTYYIKLGYEYAKRQKELDMLHEANRQIEEANKVLEQHKKLVHARRRLHYLIRYEHDHDNDKPIFTAEGKMIVTLSENIPSWVDDDESYDNLS
jgi:DNA gyrase/topoisomerase IV subunit A